MARRAARNRVGAGRGGRDLRRGTAMLGDDFDRARRNELIHHPPIVQLQGKVPARPGLIGCIPREAGVYIFFDLRGPLYVGSTGDLHMRFLKHLRSSHNALLAAALRNPVDDLRFGWLLAGLEVVYGLERSLIRALRPICNKLHY